MQGVTSALEPLSDDQSRRFRAYAIQMTIRTACFFGAVLIDHWIRWVLVAGAVVLPYIAVLLVNAGRDHTERTVVQVTHPEIEAGSPPSDDVPRDPTEDPR